MCPDRQLLSAFADGEVPEPWNGRLARHLASCRSCRSAVERFQALSDGLRAAADLPRGPEEAAILARIGAGLERALESRDRSAAFRPGSGIWRRRIMLPLPAAAAAIIVVAAVLVLSFVGLSFLGQRGAATMASAAGSGTLQATATAEMPAISAQPTNMDELLRYLDSKNGQVTLTIRLPNGANFERVGAPVLQVAAPPAPDQKDGSQ
ncbi:MAG TPA: zf-HC2 domain-containing protein [Rectinemataceae bacterium]|nr:zf-HC2 domain-containing protein [Rectinemataceae bacterium]